MKDETKSISLALAVSQRRKANANAKANAAGADESRVSPTQQHLFDALVNFDEAWISVRHPEGIRALNRRFGLAATTEALMSLVDQVRLDGLVARNPFALLWTATAERAGREVV